MALDFEFLSRVLALAASLESEGQYNNAKLMRGAAEALLTHSAHQRGLPADHATLQAETSRLLKELSVLSISPDLLACLEASREALAEGTLPTYVQTPDPYVCRICGHARTVNAGDCPDCGAAEETFKRFRPIYWIEALDPFESLRQLRATPLLVASLLEGVSDVQAGHVAERGGWSLNQAVKHLSDAQGVFSYRVNLMLDQDNPVLESKAVFEWAAEDSGHPATVFEILESYRLSRAAVVTRLEEISLKDWWRTGRHQEFGDLRLYEQVSYFASHELTHLHQLRQLAKRAG